MADKESVKYSIIPELIKLIPFSKYENNFVFIVNNKKYYTNRICADILSPIIRNFHFVDESINEYSFNIDDEIDLFSEFLQLVPFNEVELDQKHVQCFSKYFLKLGNIAEYINLNESIFDCDTDNLINICFDLYQKYSTAMPCELIQGINDLIADNFYKIQNTKDLSYFDLDFLEGIISNQSLIVNDEDSLLNCILDLYEEDHKYSRLFEYIHFSNVDKDTLQRFFETFSLEDINQSLWQSIISIFFKKDEKIMKKQNRYKKKIENKISIPKEKKVVFLGDTGCGKTSIIWNKLKDGDIDSIFSTTSTNYYNITIQNANLNIYDTPGQEQFRSLISFYLRDVDVFVIVYDTALQQTDANSYLNEWIQFIDNGSLSDKKPEVFIVYNKIDLVSNYDFDVNNENIENGRKFAKEHNYHFITTSARTMFGIDELFDEIAQISLQQE